MIALSFVTGESLEIDAETWRGAILAGMDFAGAYFVGANLCGASLVGDRLDQAHFRGAKYDHKTIWPSSVRPDTLGMVKVA